MSRLMVIEAFRRGVAFVEAQGRPLDVARLRFRLGTGTAAAVVAALEPYQNADGGFGHGLEPDLASPASSAIATTIAFQALGDAGIGADEPMVRRAMGWLEMAFDWTSGTWPIIDAGVDRAPHAPWWAWDADLAARWNGFRFNPSAELLGVLYAWREAAALGLVERAERALIGDLAAGVTPRGAYDLKCLLRLIRTADTPKDLRATVERLARKGFEALAPDDAAHAPLLELAPRPGGRLAELFEDGVDAAFDRMLAEQQVDGSWAPFWDWSEVDADAWRAAERDWRGVLTRQALEALLAYGQVTAEHPQ